MQHVKSWIRGPRPVVYLDSEGLVSMNMSQQPHEAFDIVIKFAQQCGQERGYSTPCVAELTGLSSVLKPQKLS